MAIIEKARKTIKEMEDDFKYNHFHVPGYESETKKDPYNEAIKAVMLESTFLAQNIHSNRAFDRDWLPVVVAVEYIGSSLHTWYQKNGSKDSQKSDGGVEDARKELSLFDATQADPAAFVAPLAGVDAAAQTGATPPVSSLATGGATGSDRVRDREEENDQTDVAVVDDGSQNWYSFLSCGMEDLLADLLSPSTTPGS